MVLLPGEIDFISMPKEVNKKTVVKVSIQQKEPGQQTQIRALEVWSDHPLYQTVIQLEEGQKVTFKVNDFCEKIGDRLTGHVKYSLVGMCNT